MARVFVKRSFVDRLNLFSDSRRYLVHTALRTPINKPPPYPYKEKGYPWYMKYVDGTLKRMDESSKLILVEGNIGSGKSSLAKELAQAFDFYHLKEPSMDDVLINEYGSDLRNYYEWMKERTRFFDVKMFYERPAHPNVAQFQDFMYRLRFEQYMNALAHILNTGQGVIMERSVFSDQVFVEALARKEILDGDRMVPCVSPEFHQHYRLLKRTADSALFLKPHLTIYLDVPASVCLERIKKRGISYEVNSPVMDVEYLSLIEQSYKQNFLVEMRLHSEMLIYDWTEPLHTDTVVEDIEGLELGDEKYNWRNGEVFKSWWHFEDYDRDWNTLRHSFTDKTELLQEGFCMGIPWDVGELCYTMPEFDTARVVMQELHHGDYEYGFNPGRDSWKNIFLGNLTGEKWREYGYIPMAMNASTNSRMGYQQVD